MVGGQQAAEASECAHEQDSFWEYHNGIFIDPRSYTGLDEFVGLAEELGLDSDQFRQCLESGKYSSEVAKDYSDGAAYGVRGTPTFFVNGERLVGAQSFSQFKAIIDAELKKNK